jgi:uncharacterized tellurite resistance protein B-like protein
MEQHALLEPPEAAPPPTMESAKAISAFALASSDAWGGEPAQIDVNYSSVVVNGDRTQNSNEVAKASSRPTSARPLQRSSSSQKRAQTLALNPEAVASQLQHLIEEGEEAEDEMVDVQGQPSQLSLSTSVIEKHGGISSNCENGSGLETEDSQELKRRIFPAEVVQALDNNNKARLQEIRTQWTTLCSDVEQRNRSKLQVVANNEEKLDQYRDDVIMAYAESFVKEAIYGAAVRTTVNNRLIQVRYHVNDIAQVSTFT